MVASSNSKVHLYITRCAHTMHGTTSMWELIHVYKMYTILCTIGEDTLYLYVGACKYMYMYITTHIIKKIANQFKVPRGTVSVNNAVPLLGHEDEQGKAEVGIDQRLSQTLG